MWHLRLRRCTPNECDWEVGAKADVADFHVVVDRVDVDRLAIAKVDANVTGAAPVERVVADDVAGQEFIEVYIPEDDVHFFTPVDVFTGGTRSYVAFLGEDSLDEERAIEVALSHAGIRISPIRDELATDDVGTTVLQSFDDGRMVQTKATEFENLVSGSCVEREDESDSER